MGCSSCRARQVGGRISSSCSGRFKNLRSIRVNLATLYNLTTDLELKESYKQTIKGVDIMLTSLACPDRAFVNSLKLSVDGELAKFKK